MMDAESIYSVPVTHTPDASKIQVYIPQTGSQVIRCKLLDMEFCDTRLKNVALRVLHACKVLIFSIFIGPLGSENPRVGVSMSWVDGRIYLRSQSGRWPGAELC